MTSAVRPVFPAGEREAQETWGSLDQGSKAPPNPEADILLITSVSLVSSTYEGVCGGAYLILSRGLYG